MEQSSLFNRTRPPGRSQPWLVEAGHDWLERYPEAVVPWGPIGRWLKPLCAGMAGLRGLGKDPGAGWPFVRPVWKRYLRERDERYCNAYEFATKFSHWLGSSNQEKETLERIDATRAWEEVLRCGQLRREGGGAYYLEQDVLDRAGARAHRAYLAAGGATTFSSMNEKDLPYVQARFVKAWLSL